MLEGSQQRKYTMPLNDSFLWAALCLLLLTLFHFASQRKLHDRRTLTLYAMLCCGLTITVCGLILTVFLRQRAAIHPAAQAAAVGVYLAQFAMPYLLLEITAFTCRHITSPFLKVARLLWCVGSILILSNPWTGIISAPQADGLLHVSACYGVFVWGISFWYMVDILYILYYRKERRNRQASAPAEAAAIMFVGIFLQNVPRLQLFTGLAASLATVVLYFSTQNRFAYIDFSTHIFNAAYFDYWLWERITQKRPTYIVAVYLTELERIRSVYGTDRELSELLAQKLWEITPKHWVFRARTNKYALCTDNETACRLLLKQLQQIFSDEFIVCGRSIRCPAVLTVVEHIEKGFENVDECLNYTASLLRQGSHQMDVQIVEDTPLQRADYAVEKMVEQYLPQALEQNLFEIRYQPIYSLKEQRYVGVEALSRLQHPKLGWVNPELFIRLATRNGQIFQLMPMQLHRICRFLQAHPEVQHTLQTVKMNLSPAELVRKGYCENLIAIIRSYHIPTEKFQFEVTESTATEYTPELEQCIQTLQEAGIHLCLDDFGSGYANLSSILRLPFSVIKMDRSLLQGVCNGGDAAIFYHSMVATLHAMGYQIVSEGVEVAEEASLLNEWQVDMIQGYYYAKPQTEEELLALLTSQNKKEVKP